MRQTLFCLLLALSVGPLHAALPQPVVTRNGLLQGEYTEKSGMAVFRGVPFAAPPTGANRWREPQPAPDWSGTRSASSFGPRCVQGGFAPGANQQLTSEDCLYLNIWTAAETADEALPVIIWIHGGGYFGGTGAAPNSDGEDLAAKGAVVVSINYRLGSFGFFAHPELSAESPNNSSGNYAILDMLAALRWVKDNIAAFGGDPERITLMGESAGGKAVATLIASPLTSGLFQRAILQSGAWMGWGAMQTQPSLAEREQAGLEQATRFGANSLSELRQATAQQIQENFPGNNAINVDGYLLPQDSSLILAGNNQQAVDILAGSNRDEGVFFGPGIQQADAFRENAQQRFGPLAGRFLTLYPADTDAIANASWLSNYTDELAWQLRKAASYQAAIGKQAWVYFFTRVPPGQEARGSTHVAELPYVYNHADRNAQWTDIDRQLADQMSSYWVNFAATGNPNGSGLPQWPAYTGNEVGSVMVLGDTTGRETRVVPAAEKLILYDAAYNQMLDAIGQP